MDKVEALKPCPHCGEADQLYPCHRGLGGGKPFAIDCLGCGTDFTPREGMDVVAAWNRRSPPSPDAGALAEAGEWISRNAGHVEGCKVEDVDDFDQGVCDCGRERVLKLLAAALIRGSGR